MSDRYQHFIGMEGGESLSKIDDLIKKDLKEYIDGSIYDEFENIKKMLKLWAIARTAQDRKIILMRRKNL